jgi:hypothetical protein
VAGYSRLIGADKGGTLERLKTLCRELIDSISRLRAIRIVRTCWMLSDH